jgi:peptidoglycan/LPS O-acetylase OafA/YrhL
MSTIIASSAPALVAAASGDDLRRQDVEALSREPRFVFIDSLRGIAAMAVVFHHALYSPLIDTLREAVPDAILAICEKGYLGVHVFFVISGFVIAHSLRNTVLNAHSIAWFALRRQVRLDPPYWVALLAALALWAIMRAVLGEASADPVPAPGAVGLNMLYLQKITRVPEILGVAWTLCIEIQLYVFFSLLLWLGQFGRRVAGAPSRLTVLLVLASGVTSLALNESVLHHAWLTQYWWLFASGAMCYWAMRRVVATWVFFAFLSLIVISIVREPGDLPLYTATISSALIFGVGKLGLLATLLRGPLFQYLGRISYCLYLVHWPVKIVVLGAGFQLTRHQPLAAIGWCLLMVLVSIVLAHALHVLVEARCMRWSSTLKCGLGSLARRKISFARNIQPNPASLQEFQS